MGYVGYSADIGSTLRSVRAASPVVAAAALSTGTKGLSATMNPAVAMTNNLRESRDSTAQPITTAIACWYDVTGSMSSIVDTMILDGINNFMSLLVNSDTVPGPQLFVGAVGDILFDRAPSQIGQFESETERIDNWVTTIYREQGGGGNGNESYMVPLLFANAFFECDCYIKRGFKPVMFTIGDELPETIVSKSQLEKFFTKEQVLAMMGQSSTITLEAILPEIQNKFNYYHISFDSQTDSSWRRYLGQNLISLSKSEIKTLPETMYAIVAAVAGQSADKVLSSVPDAAKSTVLSVYNSVAANTALSTPSTSTAVIHL